MKNKKKLVKKIIILFIILITCICGLIFAYKMYQDNLAFETEQAAIKAKIQEEERINTLQASKTIYLCLNETYNVNTITSSDDYRIFDQNILIYDDINKQLVGKSVGITYYYNKFEDEKYLVYVTNLYEVAHIDNDKQALPCQIYTTSEAQFLDDVLEYKINEAGYKTRAGALAAARFICLEFKYRILYFCENGRLDTQTNTPYADGEGRYYHKGLYLSSDKYNDIIASIYGPSMWGCEIYERPEDRMYYNGLDCSGYVTWLLLNAGYEPGDIGGGYGIVNEVFDCVDLGDAQYISELDFSKIKAGDLIGYSGHIGIILGIDDNNIYVGQEYHDMECLTYSYDELKSSRWEYIVLMDSYYQADGNYTNMW